MDRIPRSCAAHSSLVRITLNKKRPIDQTRNTADKAAPIVPSGPWRGSGGDPADPIPHALKAVPLPKDHVSNTFQDRVTVAVGVAVGIAVDIAVGIAVGDAAVAELQASEVPSSFLQTS